MVEVSMSGTVILCLLEALCKARAMFYKDIVGG
jgi:hypothetical protein